MERLSITPSARAGSSREGCCADSCDPERVVKQIVRGGEEVVGRETKPMSFEPENECTVDAELKEELERLKRKLGLGFEISVKWLPHTPKFRNGKQLLEEVVGDTIIIYAENLEEAKNLLAHGLAEWLLNQHTKRYRMLINKLIELFEQIQYEEKEKIADAITKLLTPT